MAVRPAKSAADQAAEIEQLRFEVAARIAECEWLREHYDRHLRAALAKDYAGASSFEDHTAAAADASAREVEKLRAEVDRVRQAERRYLDRIEELKDALDSKGRA